MKRILICEDEDTIREFVVINLIRAGYDVTDVNCGEEALRVFEAEHGNFDIVLLDIMMPGIDGFTVCKKIREISQVPIIILTAKETEADQMKGFMYGSDDYLVKPFSQSLLVLRVNALLRRANMNKTESNVTFGDIIFSEKDHTATCNNKDIGLTMTEFSLLECL